MHIKFKKYFEQLHSNPMSRADCTIVTYIGIIEIRFLILTVHHTPEGLCLAQFKLNQMASSADILELRQLHLEPCPISFSRHVFFRSFVRLFVLLLGSSYKYFSFDNGPSTDPFGPPSGESQQMNSNRILRMINRSYVSLPAACSQFCFDSQLAAVLQLAGCVNGKHIHTESSC